MPTSHSDNHDRSTAQVSPLDTGAACPPRPTVMEHRLPLAHALSRESKPERRYAYLSSTPRRLRSLTQRLLLECHEADEAGTEWPYTGPPVHVFLA